MRAMTILRNPNFHLVLNVLEGRRRGCATEKEATATATLRLIETCELW